MSWRKGWQWNGNSGGGWSSGKGKGKGWNSGPAWQPEAPQWKGSGKGNTPSLAPALATVQQHLQEHQALQQMASWMQPAATPSGMVPPGSAPQLLLNPHLWTPSPSGPTYGPLTAGPAMSTWPPTRPGTPACRPAASSSPPAPAQGTL